MGTDLAQRGTNKVGGAFPERVAIAVDSLPELPPNAKHMNQSIVAWRLLSMLLRYLSQASGSDISSCQAGLCRHTNLLLLSVVHIDYHADDDIDWQTQSIAKYAVTREGDDIVFRLARRSEFGENGIVRWHGVGHDKEVVEAWRELVSKGDTEHAERDEQGRQKAEQEGKDEEGTGSGARASQG